MESQLMALLRLKRLVRYCTQVLTFIKLPEREILTQKIPSGAKPEGKSPQAWPN